MYESGYEGPVTKDFLRLFSRALIEEKRRLTPHSYDDDDNVRVYQALDKQHRQNSISPQESNYQNDFDHSLPLPSDDIMKSPNLHRHMIEKSPSPSATPRLESSSRAPAFKSYLERILESRKNSSMFERETPLNLEDDPDDMHAVLTTSKFVIENTIHGLPEYTDEADPSTFSDMKLAEPLELGEVAVHDSPSPESSDEKPEEMPVIHRRKHSSSFYAGLDQTPQYDEIDENPNMATENFAKRLMSPSILQLDNFDEGLGDIDTGVNFDNETSGLVLGHLTIDDDLVEPGAGLQLQPGLSPKAEEAGSFRHQDDLDTSKPKKHFTTSRKRLRAPEDSSGLPKGLVKGLVSLAQRIPDEREAPRKRPRKNKLSLDVLKSISQKSNEFLLQLMSDLEAYAGHRDSNKVSIQDTVLYLTRMGDPLKAGLELEKVSKLAHDIFPLEVLVKLENSLQLLTRKKQRTVRSDSRRDPRNLLSTPLLPDEGKFKPESGAEEEELTDDERELFYVQAH